MKDFIVPDNAVDEDGEEGEEAKHSRKHKKNKVPKIKQLDEEDFELIQENTGQEVARKKKRLQKMTEAEGGQHDTVIKRGDSHYDEEESNSKVAAEGESEMIDTTSRKQIIPSAPSRRLLDQQRDVEKGRKIFDDYASLDEKAKQTRKQASGKGLHHGSGDLQDSTLETMYDADELDDQFATKAD